MVEILQQEQLHGDALVAAVVVLNMVLAKPAVAAVKDRQHQGLGQQQTPTMVEDLVILKMVTLILGKMLNQLLVVAVVLEEWQGNNQTISGPGPWSYTSFKGGAGGGYNNDPASHQSGDGGDNTYGSGGGNDGGNSSTNAGTPHQGYPSGPNPGHGGAGAVSYTHLTLPTKA